MSIDSRNTFVYSPSDLSLLTNSQSGATAVSASTAAPGASISWVLKRLTATLSASGAQAPLTINVASGSVTTGSVIASYKLGLPGNSFSGTGVVATLDLDNLHILGGANVAMAIGTAAPAASTDLSINAQVYRLGIANPVRVGSAA